MSVSSSQQEEKDRETPKDSLDDLFPNDEEEHGKSNNILQLTMMSWFFSAIRSENLIM